MTQIISLFHTFLAHHTGFVIFNIDFTHLVDRKHSFRTSRNNLDLVLLAQTGHFRPVNRDFGFRRHGHSRNWAPFSMLMPSALSRNHLTIDFLSLPQLHDQHRVLFFAIFIFVKHRRDLRPGAAALNIFARDLINPVIYSLNIEGEIDRAFMAGRFAIAFTEEFQFVHIVRD